MMEPHPLRPISLTVNGHTHAVDVEDRTLLADLLRDQLHLTGTHVGCDTSQCGCCTVLMDGDAIKSCTVLAVQADGAHITTIEGLAQGPDLTRFKPLFRSAMDCNAGFARPA
jgi:carbon-monoxide dehydrogenase small subunit